MNPKKRAKKDLQKVNKDLNKPKYAKKVEQNVQIKRQRRIIEAQITRLETALKIAKGPEHAKILKLLEKLRKADKANKIAFFKK